MGLFSKLGGSGGINLTPQAGLLLAAMTMVAIDGDVDEDELAIVRRLDRGNGSDDWDAAFKTWKANDTESCVSLSAAAMNPDQQLIAMANLIDIAMADGVLGNSERALLEAFVAAFDVTEGNVSAIVDVIAIKNDRSAFA
jgi:hypothetical protein